MQNTFRIVSISLVFLACLSFPLLNSGIKLLKDSADFENRALAKEPALDLAHLDPYPLRYETFYNDHFNLRNSLIQLYHLYKIMGFHESPIPDKVVIGKNGWLYNVGEEMDSYMGKNRLSEKELEDFKLELEYRKKYLADRGIKLYFAPVPCKASIYDENIGYEYYRIYKESWGEQLINYLNTHSQLTPINVFEKLRSVKDKTNLYFKLDNHWNSLGAFYAANGIIEHLQKDFPELKPLSLSNYNIKTSMSDQGNIQQMLGDLGIFKEINVELEPKTKSLSQEAAKAGHPPVHGFAYPFEYEIVREIKESKAPKLLLISDSFGGYVLPYLAEHFSKSVKIFDSWQYKLNEEIVAIEKPDIVVILIDEPILRNFLQFPSRPNK